MRGCPAISYGWGRGHLRLNNEAFLRFELAQVAGTPAELRVALRRALEQGRTATTSLQRPAIRRVVRAGSGKCGADLLARAGWFVAGGRTDRAAGRPPVPDPAPPRFRTRRRDHVRRRPASRRDAGGARGACTRRRSGDLLPRRRAGGALPLGGRGDRGRRPRDRDPRLPARRSCCGGRRRRCARTSRGRTM